MQTIKQIESFVLNKWTLVKAIFSIMQLEAKLAGLSLFPLILNLGFLMVVLMTLWLIASLFIGYGILLLSNNLPLSFFLVFLFNIGVMIGLLVYLKYNIKNLSFVKTRSYLAHLKRPSHAPIKKNIAQAD